MNCHLLLAACALVVSVGFALAGEAKTETFTLGDATVRTIADSTGDRDMGVFSGADPRLVAEAAPDGTSPSGIMTFVVERGDDRILIDTGLGNASGDRASLLMPGLRKLGIRPEDITHVLITHYHGDHIGGLVWDGQRAFPNATVLAGRAEHEFWLSPDSVKRYPDRQANFDMAARILGMYADRFSTFTFDQEVLPGIRSVDAVGHTPGHTAFLLDFDGDRLLVIGDLLHAAALQFPHPEINARYDMIPEQAAASRKRLLEWAAENQVPVAGMHLPFAGIGRVKRTSDASFGYLPGL